MIGLEHPGFLVSSLEESIDFYQKIGFKILRKTKRPHAMMYLGETIIELTEDSEKKHSQGFHLAFYTDNIEEEVKRLNNEGIETGKIMTFTGETLEKLISGVVEYADPIPSSLKLQGCMTPTGKWKRVAFNDPDGVPLELWQRS